MRGSSARSFNAFCRAASFSRGNRRNSRESRIVLSYGRTAGLSWSSSAPRPPFGSRTRNGM
nr:MAG TPA: hypothetical protein [Caudoviricetes sp.]DAK47067.1 MAG TPA: hypothetical protein [Caudoviricetes sp.]DAL01463.1 MAG TPA: hypothetical protein [Caudoviricetes sp.]DAS15115.1 MAG TPA: hypothetical protein [Caudoviricetes sp.]